MDLVIKAEPLKLDVNAWAFARYSKDFYDSANLCRNHFFSNIDYAFSPVPYYLYCRCIELALKALIINAEPQKIKELGKKRFAAHDLLRNLEQTEACVGSEILTEKERGVLQDAGLFYGNDGRINKGFEYFTGNIKLSMLKAYSDLPSIEGLAGIAKKLIGRLQTDNIFQM